MYRTIQPTVQEKRQKITKCRKDKKKNIYLFFFEITEKKKKKKRKETDQVLTEKPPVLLEQQQKELGRSGTGVRKKRGGIKDDGTGLE